MTAAESNVDWGLYGPILAAAERKAAEEARLNSQTAPADDLYPDGDDLGYVFQPGGDFILDTPIDPVPIWGNGSEVLLADGEALIIAGPQGTGKTTLAQQLALGRTGCFREYDDLLGYPIMPGNGRVLYLAMDRPKQAARSFRRMVGEAWREELNQSIRIWPGPPPQDFARAPSLLLRLCEAADADTVVVDSLKDAALGLVEDTVGAGYNRARQYAVAAGVQVIELHHHRKQQQGTKAAPSLDELYGSVWIPSGAGSVIFLAGAAGDPIVNLHHLKQPAVEVGPLKVIHDQTTGRSTIWHEADLLTLAASSPSGISAVDAARALFETDKPTLNEKEKARRKLETHERKGDLVILDQGDKAANRPRLWGPQ